MPPITEYLKKRESVWSNGAAKAFVEIKARMIITPVMCLRDFFKIFEVACDTSGIDIGRLLAQEGHQVAYFSEKLNGAK